MTRTVHKKIEITEDYTDGGSNFKIIFGILLGIGIGAVLVYTFLKKYQKNVVTLNTSPSTKEITKEIYTPYTPNDMRSLLLVDNHNNEKWKIVRNESGGIEEIEILKSDINNHQSDAQNNTQNNTITQPDNVDTIILKPENTNIHKHI